jgi:hypothetical protein
MTKGKYYNPIPFPNSQPKTTPENVPGSTIKCTGKPRIEPINPPADLLEQLKKDLASNKLSPSARRNKIGRTTGFCSVCGGLPTHFMIYDCSGVQKLERYCSSCLEKEKDKDYNQKY